MNKQNKVKIQLPYKIKEYSTHKKNKHDKNGTTTTTTRN